MIERVYNDELKQFVYQIKKSDFMNGLNRELAELTWNEVADKHFISLEFDYYNNASAFAKKLVNYYSMLLI